MIINDHQTQKEDEKSLAVKQSTNRTHEKYSQQQY